jgi:hypothetical protein
MDPLTLPDADDPRLLWVGYPHVASPDRFAAADSVEGIIYLYVPLEHACRWLAFGNPDRRRIELRFHPTEDDDARLAVHRSRYLEKVAVALDTWDHASIKFGTDI